MKYDNKMAYLTRKLRIAYACWFHTIKEAELKGGNQRFEALLRCTLFPMTVKLLSL